MFRRALLALTCLQLLLSASAYAQDRGALQATGLFQQSCLRFTGQPDLLRGWIRAHGLPSIPSQMAKILSGGHPALAFAASTPDGKMALVSQDDGACRVVVEHGAASSVETALTAILAQSQVSISKVSDRSTPNHETVQRLYHAQIGARRWVLSVTSHEHGDAPDTQPEIILLATVDYGQPATPRNIGG